MEILNLQTGELLEEDAFRQRHSDRSFPPILTEEVLSPVRCVAVLRTPVPPHDETTHTAIRNGVTLDSLENWVEAWKVVTNA